MAKYKVQNGDSLPKIAAKFGTTVGQLRQTNNIFSVSRGQEIKVPQWNQFPSQPLNTSFPPRPQIAPNVRNQYLSQFPGQGTMPPGNNRSQFPGQGTVVQYPYSQPIGPVIPPVQGPNMPPQYSQPIGPNRTQAAYMSQFPGQGTITTNQNAFLSQFPGQGTVNPAQTTTQAAMPVYNPAYPPAVRPTGAITPDTWSQWAAYWNYEATKPASARIPAPPQVMTKDQIWEMKKRKAVARREAAAAEQASQFTPVFVGSNVQNLALRTG